MDKHYRTRDGRPVRILCTDYAYGGPYKVLALVSNEYREELIATTEYGFAVDRMSTDNKDLIESTPYDHIHIDDKVLVWNGPENTSDTLKYRRHFARVHSENNQPLTYPEGKTSWSNSDMILSWFDSWDHCEKVED